MPNWNTLNDPFNITFDRKQFNPFGLEKITKEVYDLYLPYKDTCLTCKAIFDVTKEVTPICYTNGVCKLRPKDKKYGLRHIVTRGLGSPPSLMILSGTLAWNYENGLDFIFRACIENGIEMHHKNFDPHDNRFINIAMVDKHMEMHGKLKSMQTTINKLLNVSKKSLYNKDILREVERLQRIYTKECEGISDSPKVFYIIDIINNVRCGHFSVGRGQEELEKINAAFPLDVLENKGFYDLRKLKSSQEHLIKYHQEGYQNNAI